MLGFPRLAVNAFMLPSQNKPLLNFLHVLLGHACFPSPNGPTQTSPVGSARFGGNRCLDPRAVDAKRGRCGMVAQAEGADLVLIPLSNDQGTSQQEKNDDEQQDASGNCGR